MKVINLFGQPSAGKSTTAAGLFHFMKLKGVNCELVTEYAKQMVWREMPARAFEDQLYITAKQNQRLHTLVGKVDFAITDSPLLLGHMYAVPEYYESYGILLNQIFERYDNEIFLIKRVKPYNPIGRNQTEQESDEIGLNIKHMLNHYGFKYNEIDGGADAPQKIMDILNIY